MENRYLFRAKTKCIVDTYNFGKEDGEWVQGSLRCDCGKYTIFQFETDRADYTAYEIDPSTICQCTGLEDDDGTLIFENDVLSLKDEIDECEWKAVVKFGNPNAEYTWGWQLVPITECDANKDILLWIETEMGYMYCEVIGNTFDNPELLK